MASVVSRLSASLELSLTMSIRFPLFALLLGAATAFADSVPSSLPDKTPVTLDPLVVTAELDRAREAIVPSLGASQYQIGQAQISGQSQGSDASFNQVLLRTPGMAQDSYGQLHLRGEHANLQYRINDVLLPEGISGFGQELDTRFIDTMSLLTGSLPAQYGDRTAGVIDIHTKSGASAQGGEATLYGGSFDTLRPSFELGCTEGKLDYYITGSFLTSDLGIENPTGSRNAIHDHTDQFKGFGYFSYLIDTTSRLNLIVSGSHATFQVPNNPGQAQAFTLAGTPVFDSANLDENQDEDNAYAVVSYQKSTTEGGLQLSAFTRQSGIHFTPDPKGDLIFNGVASDVKCDIFTNGVQLDTNWNVVENHTLRGGLTFTTSRSRSDTTTAVFPVDAFGNQTSSTPFSIVDNSRATGYLYGAYLQDEWQLARQLTVNYGLRADVSDAYIKESQLSPRINVVYTPVSGTVLHAGYARYFTPPPLELVSATSVAAFNGTTNQSATATSSPVRSERAHYFDLGVTQKLTSAWSVSLDSYYKIARNQLDEGQFGQALVFSPFNYRTGTVYGAELATNYTQGGFSAYANLAVSRAFGKEITSGEFQFAPAELAYIATHDVYLDHDQRFTASAGISYKISHTLLYTDALFGSGLRSGFANTGQLPSYTTVNLGVDQKIPLKGKQELHLRVDVVNLFDRVYELRDGSGIGVGAPQFGSRRGIYGGVTWLF